MSTGFERKTVVIAGLGDCGFQVAIRLASACNVVAISAKPLLASGQDVGRMLCWPEAWKLDYFLSWRQLPALDNVMIKQGLIKLVDSVNQTVLVERKDGSREELRYNYLVICSGVSNGFWKLPPERDVLNETQLEERIQSYAERVSLATVVAIVGGGATGVSIAFCVKERYVNKEVHLFYSRARILPEYQRNVAHKVQKQLISLGVQLHSNHRGIVQAATKGDILNGDSMCGMDSSGSVHFSTGQPPFPADTILWCVGRTRPNTSFLPAKMLTPQGFVKVDSTLRVVGERNIFAVGDVAQSDTHRSSARNNGFVVVAANVKKLLKASSPNAAESVAFATFKATQYRWGAIAASEASGLLLSLPNGWLLHISSWVKNLVIRCILVNFVYGGVRGDVCDLPWLNTLPTSPEGCCKRTACLSVLLLSFMLYSLYCATCS